MYEVGPRTRTLHVEEKTSGSDTFSFRHRARAQWEMHRERVRKGHEVWWAVRFKRGAADTRWRWYRVTDRAPGPLRRYEGRSTEEVLG